MLLIQVICQVFSMNQSTVDRVRVPDHGPLPASVAAFLQCREGA